MELELKCVVLESCPGELSQTGPVCDGGRRGRACSSLSSARAVTPTGSSEPLGQNARELERTADQVGSFTLVEEKNNLVAGQRLPALHRRSDTLSNNNTAKNTLKTTCPVCKKSCHRAKRQRGPYLIVHQSCYFCQYRRQWASQPEAQVLTVSKSRRRGRVKTCSNSLADCCSVQIVLCSLSIQNLTELLVC